VKALVFGGSGGLATALTVALVERQWQVDVVTRGAKRLLIERRHSKSIEEGTVRVITVAERYADFHPVQAYDSHFFTQALFSPRPLTEMDGHSIQQEVQVGLTEPIQLTRNLLAEYPPSAGERRDYCFIGSTSAYAGFRNTSVYCVVKHGLLGFVRALNDEYASSGARFWLCSMGTIDTEMGAQLKDQDPSSFLQPDDVAKRIVDAVCSTSNLFEPEILIRRRTIRFREK
jgi:NAD(P)-dependent dehydrogenase (short-subunit alcohol dehydrogenase family)